MTHTRDINRMEGFYEFLRSWDDPAHPQNSSQVDLQRTKYGNVSATGVPGDYRGYVLSPWHPRFADSLETGIQELVLLLVLRFKWLTYSSCQGHYYPGEDLDPVERRVGIVPRSTAEGRTIGTVLKVLSRETNRQHLTAPMYLQPTTRLLEIDGSDYAVIDLLFRRRRSAAWKTYFARLDEFYTAATANLAKLSTVYEDLPQPLSEKGTRACRLKLAEALTTRLKPPLYQSAKTPGSPARDS